MKTMSVGELKANFSAVLDLVRKGEEIAISYGKKKQKIAIVLPYSHYPATKERPLGILKGKASCVIREDFKLDDEEFLAL